MVRRQLSVLNVPFPHFPRNQPVVLKLGGGLLTLGAGLTEGPHFSLGFPQARRGRLRRPWVRGAPVPPCARGHGRPGGPGRALPGRTHDAVPISGLPAVRASERTN